MPLPPPEFVYLVLGSYDLQSFYQNSVLSVECIKSVLKKNGLNIEAFESILDFGCGCGRVIRQWKTLKNSKLYGTDYNPCLINWCRRSLPFAEFKVNKLTPPLNYEDNKFDFIYAISVFTHLSENLQSDWINEMKRVLKPGGYLYITVHGASRLYELKSIDQQKFKTGHMVIVDEKYAGTNYCGAYHPEQYVRKNLAKDFIMMDFTPGGAKDANQDAYLLRKPVK